MIFKLHYWFLASGANAIGILLGVFMEMYTDASSTEIGMLYMMSPFIGIVFRPLICSYADRRQAHRSYIMKCLLIVSLSYLPFVIIPMLGPEFYETHPRMCFRILVALKVVGDAAFGGVISIGDSLAINYAKRIGVDFSVYRVWGTISWMVFGVIIGQINEVWFLPKYVPGFMVLILASLMNMFVIYLWPQEYFKMVSHSESAESKNTDQDESSNNEDKKKKGSAMTKSLLPREVVWAHAKKQLRKLATFRCMQSDDHHHHDDQLDDVQKVKTSRGNSTAEDTSRQEIDKRTQLKILSLLIRRDPRIVFYLLFFICAGFSVIPISFLFISLSQICHTNNRCDFSQLGGLLQVSMALAETILFIYVKRMMHAIGRLNLMAMAVGMTCIKFTFYATIWTQVDPHYSLVAELLHGWIFGIYLTLMVEMGHYFANEVEYIIPELIERQVIPKDSDEEKLKLSLLATMQAIIANANDGIGRGVGALTYGLIVDHYGYPTLWACISIGAAVVSAIIVIVNVSDKMFEFNLGLDKKARDNKCNVMAIQELGAVDKPHKGDDGQSINNSLHKQEITDNEKTFISDNEYSKAC